MLNKKRPYRRINKKTRQFKKQRRKVAKMTRKIMMIKIYKREKILNKRLMLNQAKTINNKVSQKKEFLKIKEKMINSSKSF